MDATPHEKMYQHLRMEGFKGQTANYKGFTFKLFIGSGEADILEELDLIQKLELMKSFCPEIKVKSYVIEEDYEQVRLF